MSCVLVVGAAMTKAQGVIQAIWWVFGFNRKWTRINIFGCMGLWFIASTVRFRKDRRKNTRCLFKWNNFFPARCLATGFRFLCCVYDDANLWRRARFTTHIDEIKRNKELNQPPSSKCSTLRHSRMNGWQRRSEIYFIFPFWSSRINMYFPAKK